jgi:hypothetical protein
MSALFHVVALAAGLGYEDHLAARTIWSPPTSMYAVLGSRSWPAWVEASAGDRWRGAVRIEAWKVSRDHLFPCDYCDGSVPRAFHVPAMSRDLLVDASVRRSLATSPNQPLSSWVGAGAQLRHDYDAVVYGDQRGIRAASEAVWRVRPALHAGFDFKVTRRVAIGVAIDETLRRRLNDPRLVGQLPPPVPSTEVRLGMRVDLRGPAVEHPSWPDDRVEAPSAQFDPQA